MIFGLSLIVSCIVIYDRLRMYSIYSTLQNRYPSLKEIVQKDPILKELVGHKVPEIIVGILTGTVVGFIAGSSGFNCLFSLAL